MEHYNAIIEAREAIKKKYNALRRGESEEAVFLEKSFKPVTEPLKAVLEKTMSEGPSAAAGKKRVKKEIKEEKEGLEDEGSVDSYLQQFGEKAGSYLREMINNGKGFDHTYGVRAGEDGEWMIGNKSIIFDKNDNIRIGKSTFTLTSGLLELLFKTSPQEYAGEDKETYKRILEMTNGHKRDYDEEADSLVNRNRSKKYSAIIKDLFPSGSEQNKTGSGVFIPDTPRRSYVYWDDPNELVQRLSLLHASKNAGHTGLDREILSIVEELREAGCII